MHVTAELAAHLPFGEGLIGRRYELNSDEEKALFGERLLAFRQPVTKANTADCVDERLTLAFANGTNDPATLESRIVPQLPGGLGLATTKALVAADALIVRDAKNFEEAYITTHNFLHALREKPEVTYEDAGHEGCGASKFVERSVARNIAFMSLLQTIPALTEVSERTETFLRSNMDTTKRKLENGFYGGWSSSWHEGFLADTVPHNFASLKGDPEDHETHGHHASGLFIIREPGMGFAKNAFISATGQEAFADTSWIAEEVAEKIGVDDAERERIRLSFAADAPAVLNQLVVKGFPAFVDGSAD